MPTFAFRLRKRPKPDTKKVTVQPADEVTAEGGVVVAKTTPAKKPAARKPAAKKPAKPRV